MDSLNQTTTPQPQECGSYRNNDGISCFYVERFSPNAMSGVSFTRPGATKSAQPPCGHFVANWLHRMRTQAGPSICPIVKFHSSHSPSFCSPWTPTRCRAPPLRQNSTGARAVLLARTPRGHRETKQHVQCMWCMWCMLRMTTRGEMAPRSPVSYSEIPAIFLAS